MLQDQPTYLTDYDLILQMLRKMESQHYDLSLKLKERKESFDLNVAILHNCKTLLDTEKNKHLIEILREMQEELHQKFSQLLLENQVKIEQQSEMRNVISIYESKVYELRANLISKEWEMSTNCPQNFTEKAIKKENIHLFNLASKEIISIRNAFFQLTKLQCQVNHLEVMLQEKMVSFENRANLFQKKREGGLLKRVSEIATFKKKHQPSKSKEGSQPCKSSFKNQTTLSNKSGENLGKKALKHEKILKEVQTLLLQEKHRQQLLEEEYSILLQQTNIQIEHHNNLINTYHKTEQQSIVDQGKNILTEELTESDEITIFQPLNSNKPVRQTSKHKKENNNVCKFKENKY